MCAKFSRKLAKSNIETTFEWLESHSSHNTSDIIYYVTTAAANKYSCELLMKEIFGVTMKVYDHTGCPFY